MNAFWEVIFDGRWRTCITRAVTPVFGTDGRPVYPLRDVAPGFVARRIIALLDALPKGRRGAAHLSALHGADAPADFGALLACIQGAQVTDEATQRERIPIEELTENQGAQANVEQAYELACVTRVLSQRGGDWALPEAEAARRKEATKIVDKYNALAFTQANVQDGERIVGVYDWWQFSVEYPNATITNGFMLTHEKFVEVRQAAALRDALHLPVRRRHVDDKPVRVGQQGQFRICCIARLDDDAKCLTAVYIDTAETKAGNAVFGGLRLQACQPQDGERHMRDSMETAAEPILDHNRESPLRIGLRRSE